MREPHRPATARLSLGPAPTDADVAQLCQRAQRLLASEAVEVIVCDAAAVVVPDLAAVGALARLRLITARSGRELRLRGVSDELKGLIVLAGLADVLDLGACRGRLGAAAAGYEPSMTETPENLLPDEDADFAEEHSSTTFADEMPGGPEGVDEPETPEGEGGPGGMDP